MDHKKTVLVTGASGFIGRHLVNYLAARGYSVIAASREATAAELPNVVTATLADLSQPFDWQPLLQRCDAVVHLAGIAHTKAESEFYDRVNHGATEALAQAASRSGVHLIFISSVAAQSGTFSDQELTEADPPQPDSDYGRSKLAAEQAVRTTCGAFTILRPVVVYGDCVKGKFGALQKIAALPLPLPFGALTARRSVLSIENLNSAIIIALDDPRARGETLIVSNPTPVTIPEIIRRYRVSRGKPPWLIPIPENWLGLFFKAMGRSSIWHGIGHPLIARPTKLLALGWKPLE